MHPKVEEFIYRLKSLAGANEVIEEIPIEPIRVKIHELEQQGWTVIPGYQNGTYRCTRDSNNTIYVDQGLGRYSYQRGDIMYLYPDLSTVPVVKIYSAIYHERRRIRYVQKDYLKNKEVMEFEQVSQMPRP